MSGKFEQWLKEREEKENAANSSDDGVDEKMYQPPNFEKMCSEAYADLIPGKQGSQSLFDMMRLTTKMSDIAFEESNKYRRRIMDLENEIAMLKDNATLKEMEDSMKAEKSARDKSLERSLAYSKLSGRERYERKLADAKIELIENKLQRKWLERRIAETKREAVIVHSDFSDGSEESESGDSEDNNQENEDTPTEAKLLKQPLEASIQTTAQPTSAVAPKKQPPTMVWRILHSTTFHLFYITTCIAIIVFFMIAHSKAPQK